MVSLTALKTHKLETRGSGVAALVAVLLLLAMVPPMLEAGDGNAGNPGVIPPDAKAYGMTYGEWSAKWWQ